MDSIGDYFKETREKKGLSLEQISSQTRIPEYHLQALEAEDFANLPAKVFTKGFVRSYAKVLELDEEEVLQRFLQSSSSFYDHQQPDAPQPHMQVTLEAPPSQGPNWGLVIGIIVVLGAFAVWFGFPEKQDAQITGSEAEAPSVIEEVEEHIPVVDETNEPVGVNKPVEVVPTTPPIAEPLPQKTLPTAPTQMAPQPTPPVPPRPSTVESPAEEIHTLEIEATQLTWVVVKSDTQAPNEALLQPGQRMTWKANNQFMLTLGNAAGVLVRLNGVSQGPFGKAGQVVRDIRLRP